MMQGKTMVLILGAVASRWWDSLCLHAVGMVLIIMGVACLLSGD